MVCEVGVGRQDDGRTISKKIRVETNNRCACVVNAGRTQLLQALLNICVNGADGGTLSIECRSPGYGETDEAFEDEMPDHVCLITITDSGTGMDPETCTKVAEPFDTTRDLGEGTGNSRKSMRR